MMRIIATILVLISLAMAGCERSVDGTAVSSKPSSDKYWDDLSSDDVIVKVNGKEFKKSGLEDLLRLRCAILAYKFPTVGYDNLQGAAQRAKAGLVRSYITRTIYVDEALRLGITSNTNDLREAEEAFIRQFEIDNRPTFESFNGRLDSKLKDVLASEIKDNSLVEALMRTQFPQQYTVDPKIIGEVREDVEHRNKLAEKAESEAFEVAKAAEARINAGEDFSVVAEELSQLPREEDALWGEVSPDDVKGMYPEMYEVLSKLGPGQHTGVMELDDAIHIVMLFDKKGHGGESVFNNTPETWDLGEIVIKLPQYFKASPAGDIIAHYRKEQLADVRKELYKRLSEKAIVEFPNGTNVLSSVAIEE